MGQMKNLDLENFGKQWMLQFQMIGAIYWNDVCGLSYVHHGAALIWLSYICVEMQLYVGMECYWSTVSLTI